MINDKVTRLKNLLKDSETQDPAKVRKEAKEFLKSIDAQELIFAEQQLMSEGLQPESLSALCAAHLELLQDDLDSAKGGLEDGHPIKTLMLEHEAILGFLDELEAAIFMIKKSKKYTDVNPKLFLKLKEITGKLLESDSHYEREEEALFPVAQDNGIFGPPQIMINEHKVLRPLKKLIDQEVDSLTEDSYQGFKNDFVPTAQKLIQTLRDHIYKENNILFPAALQAIPKDKWSSIKKKADKIGYCSFTPDVTK